MLEDLVTRCRSFRRFDESVRVDDATLRELVDLARLSPCGGNNQPLKFLLSNTAERNARIFPSLAWAGSLPDWPGPAEGERPTAYVVILGDTEVSRSFGVDHGIAAHGILLGAMEKGLGGCMLGAIKRTELKEALGLPDRYEILLVVAFGKPAEKVVLEDVGPGADIRYYRDAESTHHVPKRTLDELILRHEAM